MLENESVEERENIFIPPQPEVVIDFDYKEGTLIMAYGSPFSGFRKVYLFKNLSWKKRKNNDKFLPFFFIILPRF